MKNQLEHIVKMTIETQNQHIRQFSRVDITMKLKIIQQQKALFHKLKSVHSDVDNTVLTLASLVLAVNYELGKLDDVNLNVMKIRSKNIKKRVKREKLLGYWAIVRTLKLEQNMSLRQIAQYLKKYHRLDVAHSTIYELWKEIEGEHNEK